MQIDQVSGEGGVKVREVPTAEGRGGREVSEGAAQSDEALSEDGTGHSEEQGNGGELKARLLLVCISLAGRILRL